MCDRQAQLDLWRAGYAAGAAQQADLDRRAILEGARAYQGQLIRQAVELLAELLAADRAARHRPSRRYPTRGPQMRRAA